jgi:hypothetical protein
MNKTIISWSHYLYATITASVLAYVTVMDSSKDSDDSAISMLPNIDFSIKTEEPVYVEESVPEVEPVSVPVAEPVSVPVAEPVSVPVAEPVSVPVPVAEPVKESQVGSSRKKLKNNKTKTSKKNSNSTKTHRRH